MVKIACLALLLAGIVGWAVRDEAKNAPGLAATAKPAPPTRSQYARMVSDNAPQRTKLKAQYPLVWKDLAAQTRRDLGTCVVTEVVPGVLKAECR